MGTRGAVGFHIGGVDKVAYNHFDSYIEGLGQDVVKFLHDYLKRRSVRGLVEQVKAIEFYDEDVPPTPEQQTKYSKYADTRVSNHTLADWYCLLRNLQGDLAGYLEAGIMQDSHEFLTDSLFCEWAYIVNLDTSKLEVYQGFQDKPHDKGRYSSFVPKEKSSGNTYYAVALIAEIPLDAIREKEIELAGYLKEIGAIKSEDVNGT